MEKLLQFHRNFYNILYHSRLLSSQENLTDRHVCVTVYIYIYYLEIVRLFFEKHCNKWISRPTKLWQFLFIWSSTTSQPFSPLLHSWLSEIRGGLTVCVSISSHFLHAWLVPLCSWRRRQFNSQQKRLLVLLYDNLTSSWVGEVSVLATDRAGRLREFIFLSSDWVLVTWESFFSCSLHSSVIT